MGGRQAGSSGHLWRRPTFYMGGGVGGVGSRNLSRGNFGSAASTNLCLSTILLLPAGVEMPRYLETLSRILKFRSSNLCILAVFFCNNLGLKYFRGGFNAMMTFLTWVSRKPYPYYISMAKGHFEKILPMLSWPGFARRWCFCWSVVFPSELLAKLWRPVEVLRGVPTAVEICTVFLQAYALLTLFCFLWGVV